MKLTREQVIAEHRKMWKWIAEQYENGKGANYLQAYILKEKYLLANKYYDLYSSSHLCFLCDYVHALGKRRICNECPLDWGATQSCMGTLEEAGLYKQLRNCHCNKDYEKCAKLARQIAELPEKQQIIHYNKEETHTEERIDDD